MQVTSLLVLVIVILDHWSQHMMNVENCRESPLVLVLDISMQLMPDHLSQQMISRENRPKFLSVLCCIGYFYAGHIIGH